MTPHSHRTAAGWRTRRAAVRVPGDLAIFCDIYIVELNAAHTPSMPPRRLTTQRSLFTDSLDVDS